MLDRDLEKGEEIHVQVLDMTGEVVGNGYGYFETVSFRDNRDKRTRTPMPRPARISERNAASICSLR